MTAFRRPPARRGQARLCAIRFQIAVGGVLLVLACALAAPALAAPCDGIRLADSCLVTRTAGAPTDPAAGFALTNAGGVPLWDFYQTLDLQKVGYPISQRFAYKGFAVQAFQKAMLQWRPEQKRFDWLNTLDIVANDFGLNLENVPAHAILPEDRGVTEPATIERNHLKLLDQNPAIRAAFLAEVDWRTLYGLPISCAVLGNGAMEVLRAQRMVLDVWRVPAPGTTVGVVGRQNIPDKIKKIKDVIIPEAAKQPVTAAQAEAGLPLFTPTPPATPNSTATPAQAPAVPTPAGPGLSGYGMQGEFRRSNDFGLIALVQGAGFNWIKQQVTWADVELRPDDFQWDEPDRLVNNAHSAGLQILMGVIKAPNFYKPAKLAGQPGAPVDLAKFHRLMFLMASRYRGKVQAYEMWNEVDLAREWGPLTENAPAEYLDLLRLGYRAVKEADPNALVALGALTPTGVNDPAIAQDDRQYLERLLGINQGEAANYFDALGVHPFGGPHAPDDTMANPAHSRAACGGGWANHASFFFDRYKELYQVLLNAGIRGKTVWFTEVGWPSTPNPAPGYTYAACISEQDQAALLARAFQKVRAESPYVTHIFIWNLKFQQVFDPDDERWAFAIIRRDGAFRPAYVEMRDMPKG